TGAASIGGVLALPTTLVLGRGAVVSVVLVVILVAAVAISAVRELFAAASQHPARLVAWHVRERQALFVFDGHPKISSSASCRINSTTRPGSTLGSLRQPVDHSS